MNGLYIAKKQLRWAGILDIFFSMIWGALIFIFAIYHFAYLLPNKYTPVNGSTTPSSTTVSSSSGIIQSKGYSGYFGVKLMDFLFFSLTLWDIILFLFILALVSFIGKVVLGSLAWYQFFRGKSIRHIYAASAVIFFPCLGGMIALNTYKATTSRLAPKYVSPNSSFRFRVRGLWNSFSNSDTFKPELKKLRDA